MAIRIPDEHDHDDLRQAVRDVCSTFDGAYWRGIDEARAYPEAFAKALTEGGWLAALVPEEFGGSGLGLTEASIIMEEINRSGGNAGAVHGQMYNMSTLLRAGSPAQKQAYLPAIARGELRLQSMAVTEPTTGTDTTKLKTTAVRKGDRYVVNGQKVWTSRLQHSDLMILLARTTPLDQVKRKSDGLSVFIVNVAQAMARGMTVKPIRNMVNHETNEVFFDDLEIPAENLIGEENNGFRIILEGLNAERVLIAAECVGDAYWFVDRAKRYATDRVVFDRPIGRTRASPFPSPGHMCRPRPPTRSATAPPRFTMRASPTGRKPTWPRCCAPMHRGRPQTPACRPMAASASLPNTTSSANFVRRGSIRSLPSRRT